MSLEGGSAIPVRIMPSTYPVQGGAAVPIQNAPATDLISTDASNQLEEGSDGKLFVPASGGSTYLVYTARLSQSGSNAPVPLVLENTLGITPTWVRHGTGEYGLDLGALYDQTKIWAITSLLTSNDDFLTVQLAFQSANSGSELLFQCVRVDTAASVELHTAASAPHYYVEVRVYP